MAIFAAKCRSVSVYPFFRASRKQSVSVQILFSCQLGGKGFWQWLAADFDWPNYCFNFARRKQLSHLLFFIFLLNICLSHIIKYRKWPYGISLPWPACKRKDLSPSMHVMFYGNMLYDNLACMPNVPHAWLKTYKNFKKEYFKSSLVLNFGISFTSF